jgi:Spy/CpxP family protein refolding chaperone
MMKVISSLLTLVVVLMLATSLWAADEKAAPGGKPEAKPSFMGRGLDLLNGLNLTDQQKSKLEEIRKEFGPKLSELSKKMQGIYTEEQKKARDEAVKAAREAGKNFIESRKAIEDAVKLTDAQKKTMEELRKEIGEVQKKMRDKVDTLLTSEQREQLQKAQEKIRERVESLLSPEQKERLKKLREDRKERK